MLIRGRPHVAGNDERGTVLPLVAMTLVVLIVFTAFVVDLGPGYNERRQDQTTADAAALAGAAALPSGLDAVAAAVIAETQTNLPSVTAADWTACTDTPPADYTLFPTASPGGCIAINASGTRVHVKIPLRTIPSNFAQVIGISSYTVSASAEAQISPIGVLPLPANVSGAGASLICMKTPTNGQAQPPCDGSSGGNFGYLATYEYGNEALGTTQTCTPSNHLVIQNSLAVGVDHQVVPRVLANGTLDVQRNDFCAPPVFHPNHLFTQTGTTDDDLSCSLFDNSSPPCVSFSDALANYPGAGAARLERGSFRTANLFNQLNLDNEPLAYFIDPALESNNSVPASCWPSAFHGASGSTPANYKSQMAVCLAAYDAMSSSNPPPLFTRSTLASQLAPGQGMYDIQLSSRFAFVPQSLQDLSTCNGNCSFDIAGDRAIFLQTAFFDCNANTCTTWDPGEGVPSGQVHKLQAISAFRFNAASLPSPVVQGGPGGLNPRVSLIR
jgi:Flp pilus assembly protein TadG